VGAPGAGRAGALRAEDTPEAWRSDGSVSAGGARGVPFGREPHLVARLASTDRWMACFRDSEGDMLVIPSEVLRGA
jgi:hypothetical protein